MPIAAYPYKPFCIHCRIATIKWQLVAMDGGAIACKKHKKEQRKEYQKEYQKEDQEQRIRKERKNK